MPDQPGGITPLDIFAGGVPLAGNIINAVSQSASNRAARKFQLEMYARQRADALADWNMQNEYNSPQAMMQRYVDAGLNKNMIYGQGTQASTPVRQAQAGNYSPKAPEVDFAGVASSVLMSRLQNTQIGNLEKQREVLDEEKKLKAANTLAALTNVDRAKLGIKQGEWDLMMKQSLAPFSLESAALGVEKLRKQIPQIEAQTEGTKANTQFTIDENIRKEALQKNTLALQVESILTAQKGRDEATERINQMKKDGTIKDFEISLNKLGLTKSDPVYYRILKQFIQDPKKVVEKLKQANPLDSRNWPEEVNPGFQQIF